MKHSKFIRALTLFSFLFLITSFLLYRVGLLERYFSHGTIPLQTSHNGGTLTSSQKDTPNLKRDSSKKLMLSSSKVLILTDDKHQLIDTSKRINETDSKKLTIMSSSKSSIIFEPPPNTKSHIDSLRDSVKVYKKKEQ